MDEADIAQETIDKTLALQIAQARAKAGYQPTAHCLNCGEPARPGGRYCSKECVEDDEARARHLRRTGAL